MKIRQPQAGVRALVLAAVLGACAPARAWNDLGHMTVAAVAWQQLQAEPAVRSKINGLLQLNPQYARWTQGVPAAQRGVAAFLMASRWADSIKGQSGYVDDGRDGGNTPVEPVASQNIGYADKNRHKYWHFKDIGFSSDGTAVEPPETPNVQTQIERFRATLAYKPAHRDLKSYDLVWLLHLVGDVHQPLHATSRFSADHPHGDIGGNTVQVRCGPGGNAVDAPMAAPQNHAEALLQRETEEAPAAAASCPPKLHGVWDGALGNGQNVSDALALAATLPPAPADRAAITNVGTWLQESLDLAQAQVYQPPVGASGSGPYTLDAAYRDNAARLAAQRVALAGARLARLLVTALK